MDISEIADLFSSDHEQAPYTIYKVRTRYVTDPGVLQCPVAQTGAPAAVIAVAGQYGVKVVEWLAQRPCDVPSCPAADPSLVHASPRSVSPGSRDLMADGTTAMYRIPGRFTYYRRQPVTTFAAAATPFDREGGWVI